MIKFKVKVAQHVNGQWAVSIGNGSEWRVYHESGVNSVAVHASRVLRQDAKRLPELLQAEFDKASAV